MIGSTILLVEDEGNLRKLIKTYLEKEKVNVVEASDGKEALELWEENKYDLVILDIMLPEYDGWTVCKRIRQNSHVPIIMLTARSEVDDKLFGFELGADDYVTKPFSVKELVARVRALLKRSSRRSPDKVIEVEGLKVDEKMHQAFLYDEPLDLTPKEYDLLLVFLHNQNRALTREIILDNVWGYDYYGDLRTVDTHVKRLRKKLEHMGKQIVTVRGLGYRFEVAE